MDKPIARPSIREGNERTILAAAEAVFAERGFGGATMAAIAARAGVPKPNVYYYFPTKEKLYRAVVEQVLTAWLDAAHSFDTSDDPAEALTAYIEAKMDLAREMPLSSQHLGERDHARRAGHPGFSRHHADAMGALARAGGAATGSRAGKLRPIEPQVAVLHDLGDDPALRQRRPRDRDAGGRPAAGRRGVRARQATSGARRS